MKYYFIDYENVHADGFIGIEKVEQQSEVYILYAENCKNISLDVFERAGNKAIRIFASKVTTVGKNSLDFQLSTLLGYTIGTTEDAEYVIISKDAGYDAVVYFWKIKGKKISRANSIEASMTENA